MKKKTSEYFREKGISPVVAYVAQEWTKENCPPEIVVDLNKTLRYFDDTYEKPPRLIAWVTLVEKALSDKIKAKRELLEGKEITLDLLIEVSK